MRNNGDFHAEINTPDSIDNRLLVDIPRRALPGFGIQTNWLWMQIAVLFCAFAAALFLGLVISHALAQMPDLNALESFHPNESTLIFDRYNHLIANIHGDEDRVVVPLQDISKNLQRAVLATEDNRFYEHFGIDAKGTARALVTNVVSKGGRVEGGSSITQQLVKNLFLSPERSIKRKIAEAVLALKVEATYPKDKILEMYLNQVYFGNLSYGAEKAAQRYFHKPAKELTLAEASLLAGLLTAPEALSPYRHPEAAGRRQKEVLKKMLTYGYISNEQYKTALNEKLVLNHPGQHHSKYPYFVSYVIQELESKFGRDMVRRGGLRVYTTLDPDSQDNATNVIETTIKKLPKASNVTQGALVAIDVQTGEILALVGGVDFEHNQFNSATQARRAVGSTFKPFVYLTGLREDKIIPTTPICDKPVSYGDWSPKNWDGRYFGCMNIRRALSLSRNTPTVQIGMKVGIEDVIETAKAAGIQSVIDPNSSSFLGSSGVSPLELVTAYSTFARGGIYMPATSIRKVVDNRGYKVRIEHPLPHRVFDQDPVAALVDIMIDVVNHGTGVNARLKDRLVAGKTGTTDDVRDIWFMGFTPDLVAGVWFGHPANKPLKYVFSTNAASAWQEFATEFYKKHPRPPVPFFTASGEYALKAHLAYLFNKEEVAEARKKAHDANEDNTLDTVFVKRSERPITKVATNKTEQEHEFTIKINGERVDVPVEDKSEAPPMPPIVPEDEKTP